MAGTRIGYALAQVLEEVSHADNSVSPTDLTMDIHDASVSVEGFLEKWTRSADPGCKNVANALLPLFREISQLTQDKYKLAKGA